MSPESRPSLMVVSGPAADTRLEIGEEPLEIGREAGESGRLANDRELSRRHARIACSEGGHLVIEDLGSTNGTFVNGKRIEGLTPIGGGDTVALGGTTLRVTAESAAPAKAAPAPAVGGVHEFPTELFSLLISRAPVKGRWIVRAAFTALPIVFAINLFLRTIAVEYLDVPHDVPSMRPYSIFMVSVMPTLGNCVGFYKNFGRPAHHSVAHYLIPTSMITLTILTIWLILIPDGASVTTYVVTVVIVVVAPSVVVPTLLGLRVRAELSAERKLRGKSSPRAA